MRALFGPAGNSDSFAQHSYRSALDVPRIIKELDLDCYEYQCGRGVNIPDEKAARLGDLARERGVALSLHAPYYISLASVDEQKRANSVQYILASARAAKQMGATRIVIHPGGTAKFTREQAMEIALDTFSSALRATDEQGYGEVFLCPETMGKINQLGTLDEILAFCKLSERTLPTLDFGHLNCREQGWIKGKQEYARILDAVENAIGADRMRIFHAHFSKIEYSASGEVRHLTFADKQFGPDFEPLMEVIAQKGCTPVIICESAGTQAEDALAMKRCYGSFAAHIG